MNCVIGLLMVNFLLADLASSLLQFPFSSSSALLSIVLMAKWPVRLDVSPHSVRGLMHRPTGSRNSSPMRDLPTVLLDQA